MKYKTMAKKIKGLALAIAISVAFLSGSALCQNDYTSVCIQKTPPQGGTINLSAGVHNIPIDSEITLTAIPKPGYQFVYWLGDVSDPASNNTIAYIDSPKIIIAVFEKAEYEFIAAIDYAQPSVGGGGLRRSAADYSRQGYTGGGGKRPHPWYPPTPPEPPEQVIYVPGESEPDDDDGIPVPIPEPATGILLGLGSLALRKIRKIKTRL